MQKRITDSLKLATGEVIVTVASKLAKASETNLLLVPFFKVYRFLLSLMGLTLMPIKRLVMCQNDDVLISYQLLYKDRNGISVVSTSPFFQPVECFIKKLPDLYFATLNNVLFSGNSDLIINSLDGTIINDFCYNKNSNILCLDNLLYREKDNWGIVRKLYRKKPIQIEKGVFLCGKYAGNYYHSLYENLNRLLLVSDELVPKDVPLLIDEKVLSIQSLYSVANHLQVSSKREIIPVSQECIYQCGQLYYFNHINELIPHRKITTFNAEELNLYDPDFLLKQRAALLSYKSTISTPKRIFLTRANATARCYNESDIFEILKKFGFEMIAPEKFTFDEQMALFNNADFIVGGTGAAFANVLFCQSGSHVLCFRSLKGDIGDTVFKSLAWVNNVDFWHYVPDTIVEGKGVHANYYITPSTFENTLQKLWGKYL